MADQYDPHGFDPEPTPRTPVSARLFLAATLTLVAAVGLAVWASTNPGSPGAASTNEFALVTISCMAGVMSVFLFIVGFTFRATERRRSERPRF